MNVDQASLPYNCSSTSFILILQNHPIRTLYVLDMTSNQNSVFIRYDILIGCFFFEYLYKTSTQKFYNLYELIHTLSPTTYILYFNYPCFKISLSQHTFRNEYEFIDTSFSRLERHILNEPRKI